MANTTNTGTASAYQQRRALEQHARDQLAAYYHPRVVCDRVRDLNRTAFPLPFSDARVDEILTEAFASAPADYVGRGTVPAPRRNA